VKSVQSVVTNEHNPLLPIDLDSSQMPDTTGQPVWQLARHLFPLQGSWTEQDYWELSGGPLVEFDNGYIEVLDVPTKEHQRLAQYIFVVIREFLLGKRIGEVFMAPLPMRLWEGKFREPDVLFVRNDRAEYQGNYPEGADLVVEVVSSGHENRRRDFEVKRSEYAKAGIAEYWIMDPQEQAVTVLHQAGQAYDLVGHFRRGETASSVELPGLEVSVDSWLDAASR
jgi:Uma2 family endonuclease